MVYFIRLIFSCEDMWMWNHPTVTILSQIYLPEANVNIHWKHRRQKFHCDRSGLDSGLINMGCAPSLPLRGHTRGSRQSSTASLPNNASLATDNCQQQHKENDVTSSSLHIVFTSNDRMPTSYFLFFAFLWLKYLYFLHQSSTQISFQFN